MDRPCYSPQTIDELRDSLRWFVAKGYAPMLFGPPRVIIMLDGLEWPVYDRFLDGHKGNFCYRLDIEAVLASVQPLRISLDPPVRGA